MPVTEKQGRRHSSEVSVVVFQEGDPQSTTAIPKKDVREDTYRGSGPGGQHRNKTDSAVRLTHFPTGVVVTATEERSQHLNRLVAWQRLEERLRDMAASTAMSQQNHSRQDQIAQFRSWTWCGWRDEVKGPDGRRGSMARVLAGRLKQIL